MSNDQIIKESRESFKGQWGEVFLTMIISWLINGIIIGPFIIAIISSIEAIQKRGIFSSEFLISFIGLLITILLYLLLSGPIWVWKNDFILKKSRGEDVSISSIRKIFSDLLNFKKIEYIKHFFTNKELMFKTFLPTITMLVFTSSILLGYVLLIVPGIILSFMFVLVPFIYVEEKDLQPIEVLKKSKEKMDGQKMKLFWCYINLLPLFLLCVVTCGIGLFWFGPFLQIVSAKFYDSVK